MGRRACHFRQCCGVTCQVCQGGISGRVWRLTFDGFASMPDPGPGDESPYYQVTNAEDLNIEVLITDADLQISGGVPPEAVTGIENSDQDEGCSVTTGIGTGPLDELENITLHTKIWTEDEEGEWSSEDGPDTNFAGPVFWAWLDKAIERWGATFVGPSEIVSRIEEDADNGSFDCANYTGEFTGVTEWEFPGIDTSAASLSLSIEEEP